MIELMVALVLSLVLAAGVIQLFLGNKQTYRYQEALARVQESARFALDVMTRDIRMAGYLGCTSRSLQPVNMLAGTSPASFTPDRGVVGWNATDLWADETELEYGLTPISTSSGWTDGASTTLDATTAVPGSDIIRVWRGGDPVTINGFDGDDNDLSGGVTLNVASTNGFSNDSDDIALLHDCSRSYWVQICSVSSDPAQLTLSGSADCTPGNAATGTITLGDGREAMPLIGRLYYVGKRGNVAANPPSLFRRDLATTAVLDTAEELAEGVENIQIIYGVDTDNNGEVNQFVAANSVTDWGEVIAVRISMLVVSVDDNLHPEPVDITFGGYTLTPTDRRIRQVFTTTVSLRNRMP